MDRIECMRAFVEAVKANGFAAAARTLDVPRAKISKQIQSLETMLGVQLLMRTTRSLHLTSAGAEYYESAKDILAALDDAEQRAQAGSTLLRGVLNVNAPMSFGVRVLAPLLPAFHDQHPEIKLQLSLTDQLIDPVQGGFDVTIRIADLPDSSLAARPVMPAPRVLVAAPSCLKRVGTPAMPSDLKAHALLEYGYLRGETLQLTRGGESVRVDVSGPLCTNNGDVLAVVAEAGMGIALLPTFIVDDALKAGRLVQVLPDWHAPPVAVNAIFPCATRRMPIKARAFVDFLVASLRGEG